MKQIGGYELLRELPRGRAGRRFVASAARPSALDDALVSLTLIDAEWLQDAAYLTILNAEAEAAVRFEDRASAKVFEVNRIDNEVAIVVELIDGQPLANFLERTRIRSTRLSWEFTIWAGAEIARLLQVAHATPWAEGELKGMFHGQLSPGDIYVTYGGAIKVNGIGLGRSRARLPFSDVRLAYRAPELFERHKADHLTDIYGLALVMTDAITGRITFRRDTEDATRRAVVAGEVPPVHLDAPTIPPELATLLGSALAKLPTERPSSLREIEQRLRGHLGQTNEYYAAGFAEQMTVLFKPTHTGSPPPPIILAEPPPISVPPDESWPQDTSDRIRVDEGLFDELGVDELADRIVHERMRRSGSGGSMPARASSIGGAAAVGGVQHAVPIARDDVPLSVPVPEARKPNGHTTDPGIIDSPGLLSALEVGDSDDLDSLVDAIVAGRAPTRNNGAPNRRTPPKRPHPQDISHPGFDTEDEDSRFEVERNEAPFPVFRAEAPRNIPLDDVVIEAPEEGPTSSPAATPVQRRSEMGGPILSPGHMLSDRYRIVGLLGEGGVSVVYRAEHMLLMKHVALKLMRPELSLMPTARERFQLEARSVCQLDHPNIVRVTDFGYANDGRMFLVMDLIEGESLGQMMDRLKRLDPTTALTITIQLLRGLRHAHERGVVHRDLKPDNIVIMLHEGDSQPKILDFGIAKITDHQQGARSITEAGSVFGTPRYMSPEQASGEPIDTRTDIYTIGVIMYQLLTGRLPFDGPTTVTILGRVLTQAPPPMMLDEPTREAGRALERLVLKALEKERENRYGSATELLMTIESVARDHRLFG